MRPQPPVAPAAQGAGMDELLGDLQMVMDGAFQPSHPVPGASGPAAADRFHCC